MLRDLGGRRVVRDWERREWFSLAVDERRTQGQVLLEEKRVWIRGEAVVRAEEGLLLELELELVLVLVVEVGVVVGVERVEEATERGRRIHREMLQVRSRSSSSRRRRMEMVARRTVQS